MKLLVLSDLHLSMAGMAIPSADYDLVMLAGDIHRPAQAVAWATQFERPVLYVPGNHEYYGSSLAAAKTQFRELTLGTNVTLLDRHTVYFGEFRFIGCTLWSDFRLETTEERRLAAIDTAKKSVRDFSRIRIEEGRDETFSPAASCDLFDADVEWLRSELESASAATTVVITHHAPSIRSIHPRFAGSLLNSCFVSALDDEILTWSPRLWIHGHLHDSFDYKLGATRIVCNPRGYVVSGVVENDKFDPCYIVEL